MDHLDVIILERSMSVFAVAVRYLIELEAMRAENRHRAERECADAYGEEQFMELLQRMEVELHALQG